VMRRLSSAAKHEKKRSLTTVPDSVSLVMRLSLLPENSVCADCASTVVRYVSVSLGVWLCGPCAEIHRNMIGGELSNLFTVDHAGLTRISNEAVNLLCLGGNKRAHLLLEHGQNGKNKKVWDESQISQRELWISKKYEQLEFLKKIQAFLLVKAISTTTSKDRFSFFSGNLTNWKKCWCVLSWDSLNLFAREEAEQLCILDLNTSQAREADIIELAKEKTPVDPACCFVMVLGEKRALIFHCPCAETKQEWLYAIKFLSHRMQAIIKQQDNEALIITSSSLRTSLDTIS